MNWVDLIIILTVVLFAIDGQRRGFFPQAIEIIGFLAALIASLIFYPQGAQVLENIFNIPKIAANPAGFLIIWIMTETLYSALIRPSLTKMTSSIPSRHLDQSLGFIPASANSLLILAFILLFTVSLPIRPGIKKDIFGSLIGSILVDKAQALERPLAGVFGPLAKQSLTFLTVTPEEKGSIPLEFTQKELTTDFASEKIMLDLVNQERIKFGAKPLVWNESLAQVGRGHSRNMFERGYFSHFSPEGKDVGDRLIEAGVYFNIAGENLALAPDINRAHQGLMDSPGHRRNILDPAFSKIGIGVIDGGVYGKMTTQVFTD